MIDVNSDFNSFDKKFEEVQKALKLNCPKKCPKCGRKVKKRQTSMTTDPVLLCPNSQVSHTIPHQCTDISRIIAFTCTFYHVHSFSH